MRFIIQLWRPGDPTICCLQAGEPGSQWCNTVLVQRAEN